MLSILTLATLDESLSCCGATTTHSRLWGVIQVVPSAYVASLGTRFESSTMVL